MAKSRSNCSQDIARAQRLLARFVPYSTHPDHLVWTEAMETLSEVRAALDLVEAYKPGLIDTLVNSAYEEACVRSHPPPIEITLLIARYTTTRERRR